MNTAPERFLKIYIQEPTIRLGKFLHLLKNIRLGWKCPCLTNTPAYFLKSGVAQKATYYLKMKITQKVL